MSQHKVEVIKVTEILPHKNADRLEIIPIQGFQVVSGKGQFKVGDLGIYIPPDSIVPETPMFSFVWEKDGGGQPRNIIPGEPIPEKWRRVTVRKLRKEWSEGLLLPVSDFDKTGNWKEGDDVAEVLNITHWNPPEDQDEPRSSVKQSHVRPKSLKGWIYFLRNWALHILTFGQYGWTQNVGDNEKAPLGTPPIYDVENFKHYANVFQPEEQVAVTEKIHGSNGRFLYQPSPFGGKIYAGSRKLWKTEKSSSIWRKVLEKNSEITCWLVDHPNYAIYGEVVPTQGSFTYGATKENPWFYAFDIRDPQGNWVDYDEARGLTGGYGIDWAPLLYRGPFNLEKINSLVDGQTKTAGNHIREGIVIGTYPERHDRGLGRVKVKMVSNKYLEKEQ